MACLGSAPCISLQLVGGALQANATISPDSQNLVSARPDGLFATCQRGPMARMYAFNGSAGTTGSVASGGTASVPFTNVSYDISNDPLNLLAPSCDVPNSRFVCRRSGHYQVGCSITWQNMPAAGKMGLEAFWTSPGGGVISIGRRDCTINNVVGDLPMTVQTIVSLAVGDFITFQVNNNSGNTRFVYNPYPPYGQMAWLNFIRN